MVKEIEKPEPGYYLLKGKVRSERLICNARIYLRGKEEEILPLPVSAGGNINYIIRVPPQTELLRIEVPLTENGGIVREIKVRKLNFIERLYRFYRRNLPLIFSRNEITKRLRRVENISFWDLLLFPEKNYYRISMARFMRICGDQDYSRWLEIYAKKEKDYLERIPSSEETVSFLVAILWEENDPLMLTESLSSIGEQLYAKSRVVVVKNKAQLERAIGEEDYILVLKAGDILRKSLLLCMAKRVQEKGYPHIIYADNDYIDKDGHRRDPQFKPSWSPEYFLEYDYVQSPVAFRRDVFNAKNYKNNYEAILEILNKVKDVRIEHIPILGASLRKRNEAQENLPALREHLKGVAEVERGKVKGTLRVRFRVDRYPKASVIIPTKDRYELIRNCLESLISKTEYDDYEVLVLDNGSSDRRVLEFLSSFEKESEKVRVLRLDMPFNFSSLINIGVSKAKGSVICLLNNDTEVVEKDWLKEMVSIALKKEIGVVGAKLLYPNGRVQHGGVILGFWGGIDHAFKGVLANSPGYMNRLVTLQNYLAVTAACMVFRKEVFEEVGGFDESLAVNFNDVDFCLRVYERGYRIVWTPHAVLHHLESKSRSINEEIARREMKIFKKRWKKYLERDPYYNPNLSIYRRDFALGGEVAFHCEE